MPRTVRKAVQEWEQVFTGTIPKEVGAAGSGDASRPTRPPTLQHRVGGGSSGRAEFAAACLALEDSLTHDQPIAVLTDSKGLMTVASNWVGGGKDPLLRHSPDRDILARIIKVLHQRVSWASSPCLLKPEPIGASFSTKRQTDGRTKVERISTMYDRMGLAYNLLSRGLRKELNTDVP